MFWALRPAVVMATLQETMFLGMIFITDITNFIVCRFQIARPLDVLRVLMCSMGRRRGGLKRLGGFYPGESCALQRTGQVIGE